MEIEMQKIKSITVVLFFGIAVLALSHAPAKALFIYSYTGNFFNIFLDNTPPAGSYDASMRVTGSFTVAAPLVSVGAASEFKDSVLSFTIDDGRQTLDNGNASLISFALETDAAGTPVRWFGEVFRDFPGASSFVGAFVGDTSFRQIFSNTTGSSARITECTEVAANPLRCTRTEVDQGIDANQGGGSLSVVEVPAVTVPEPSTLLLFVVGLVCLAGFGRLRRLI